LRDLYALCTVTVATELKITLAKSLTPESGHLGLVRTAAPSNSAHVDAMSLCAALSALGAALE
jgi:hypothetical protein